MKTNRSVSLFSKKGKPFVPEVVSYLKKHFRNVKIYLGAPGDVFPESAKKWKGDILISYLSPWIISHRLLQAANEVSINFHPGPPEYPGIGCFNFALYEDAKNYGVTAHCMEEKVDTGRILAVKRFRVHKNESVLSLSQKSYRAMFILFREIMSKIYSQKKLSLNGETWQRRPYLRRELEALCKLSPRMKRNEIWRRVRATAYPGMPGAYFEFNDMKFEYSPDR